MEKKIPKVADAVIIGGGIHGCAIAFNLAKKGLKHVVVLEKDYLGSGATCRSAAGIRHQFGTEINIKLASESIKIMENIEEELGISCDIELIQGGYLILAHTESQLAQLKKNAELQKKVAGVKTEILDKKEVKNLVRGINTEGILGGSFNERDGHVSPFFLMEAYVKAGKRLGVRYFNKSEVVEILTDDSKIRGVMVKSGERIETPIVVNASGPYAGIIGKMVGLDIPVYPERHQALVTEPLENFLSCMVISFTHRIYFKQTPNGNFLIGIGDPEEVKDFNEEATWQFLEKVSEKFLYFMPGLRSLHIIRQWAGLYDMTPDSQAILGKTELEGFYLDVGWSGHGLMMGPVVGKIMAELILGEEPSIDISPFSLARFKTGKLIPEPACV